MLRDSPAPCPGAEDKRRLLGTLLQLSLWIVATAAVVGYLVQDAPDTGHRPVVGTVTLAAAQLYGFVCAVLAARTRADERRAWTLMSVALGLGLLAHLVTLASMGHVRTARGSGVVESLSYLAVAAPLLAALFAFPRPPERLISRFRNVIDAAVITVGVMLVSEATVLGDLRTAPDLRDTTGLVGLAYPLGDIAICAVVLTLGMRQPPTRRLAWLCLSAGLMSLAVTDTLWVRLLAHGATGLSGSALVAGWVAVPVLVGLSTRLAGAHRSVRQWNFDVVARLLPYVPVLGAIVVLALSTVRGNPLLLVQCVVLLATVTIRQIMIVYENVTLTRDLEGKVAERTAQLAVLGSIVTTSRDAIVAFGLDRVVMAMNPAAERLLGFAAADVLGQPATFLPASSRRRLDAMLADARRGELTDPAEVEYERPDGARVPIAVTVSPMHADGQLHGISVWVQDITERQRAAAVLEQAREDALRSARVKSEFLATMSHEIRTPTNGVIGLVSLLMDTDLDAQQREYAEGVHHAGQALLDVINDILDFSKLEAGKLVLDSEDFDLRLVVEEVGDLLAPAAYAKGLELLVDFDPAAVRMVRGDHVRVRQVLLNLASNAVKFTAEGEVRITVTSAPVDDHLVGLHVEVVDTGIGIAEADQQRVFESFSQADASTTRRYGGTGLGLAISRRLMEAMGGEIGVRSALGAGSTFCFDLRLPAADPSLQAMPDLPAVGLLPARLRALVVDDNATNRTILAHQLGSWGISVDVVDSAPHALDALRTARTTRRPYDFAILDMLMPDVDGLELARLVSADPQTAGLPMIMLSSGPRLPQPLLEEVGVARWLSKPVRAAALYDSVVRLAVGSADRAGEVESERRPALVAAPAPTSPRGRVLVVEDNQLNQLVARGMVERLGFEADLVGNGVEALEALGAQTYDVVLMDCYMPVMDGFAATERIRETERGRARTPVVALTASALASDRERCLEAGMDDYVAKPIDPDELAAVLDRWAPRGADPDGEAGAGRSGLLVVPEGGHIDAAQIEGLSELRTPDGGSLLATFISSFTRRADRRLDAIRDCADRADDEALAQAAHELRGSAATIGAVRVASLCGELEHGGSRVVRLRPGVLDDLAAELELAVTELDAIAGQAA